MNRKIQNSIENAAAGWIVRRDAGLTVSEQAEFERWKAESPAHAEAIARKDRAWTALDRPLYAGQADLLLQRLEARARRRRTVTTSIAVAALLIAGVIWQVRPTASPLQPEVRGVVLTPETRMLADGSVVELRFGAEIVVEFTPAFRRVALTKGEAHFQVAKNKERPFIVAAGKVEFRAVGTAFDVQRGRDQVELLVTEGHVAVDRPDAAQARSLPGAPLAAPAMVVSAGSRIVVTDATAAELVSSVVPAKEFAERLAWRAPRLEFSEVPLAEAVALMNRHNRVQFLIDDPDLARLPVSGLFRADNTDTFARLLAGTFGIRVEQRGEIIVLKKERP